MKHSITRKITLLTAISFLIFAIVIGLLGFVISDRIIHERYDTAVLAGASTLASYLCEDELEKVQSDSRLYEKTLGICDVLTDMYNLNYIYVYVPNINDSTITYQLLWSEDGKDIVSIQEQTRTKGTVVSYQLTDDEMAVWRGEKEYTFKKNWNTFGGVSTCCYPIYNSNDQIVALSFADASLEHMHWAIIYRTMEIIFVIFVIILMVALIMNYLLKKAISEPAHILSNTMSNYLKDGKKSEPLHIQGNNEFSVIAESFNTMTKNIESHIQQINELNHEKVRTETELSVASEIQKGMLPQTDFENEWVRVQTFIQPAVYVGGDFYDYFQTADGKEIFVIADVSGKGISAAIFMARAMTLIRELALQELTLSEILNKANRSLQNNNPEMYFVTVFMAAYDPENHLLQYVNAGHNIAYVVSDTLKKLDGESGIPLGLFENQEYPIHQIPLSCGDILFMYTDGVTEATNKDNKLYGDRQLETTLSSFHSSGGKNIVEYIYQQVQSFVDGANQSDDITMLAVEISFHQSVVLLAKTENLRQINHMISEVSAINSSVKKSRLDLAAEEVFVNICSYAYPETEGNVWFTLNADSEQCTIRFEDEGVPFNPLENIASIEEYDIDAQIGGLGRFLTEYVCDESHYEYADGRNCLTLIFRNS